MAKRVKRRHQVKHSKKSTSVTPPLITLLVIILGVMAWYSLPRAVPTSINLIGDEVIDPSSSPDATVEPTLEPTAAPTIEPTITPTQAPQKPNKPTGLRSNCFDGGNQITLRWDSVGGADSYKLRLKQNSGSDYKSIDNITKTEFDLSLTPGGDYSWWVHASKNGLDSEEAKIDEVICTKVVAEPTPTPATTMPPVQKTLITPKPVAKPTPQPTKTTTITPPPIIRADPTIPPDLTGSLNDIYTDQDIFATPTPKPKPGLIKMISLGWTAIFALFGSIFE